MRVFDTGATRNTDTNKLDFDGFFSHRAMVRFSEYMHRHRLQADGELRDSDNWKKGIPREQYIKSMFRHFMDVWMESHMDIPLEAKEESVCALMFNVQGYLYQLIKEQ